MANRLERLSAITNILDPVSQVERRFIEDDNPNVDEMSYEELIALEDRIGNVNRGFSKERINVRLKL